MEIWANGRLLEVKHDGKIEITSVEMDGRLQKVPTVMIALERKWFSGKWSLTRGDHLH